jgi:hypothetical protein
METILAIVVVTAVIFFGALISMGNERQRRAIDNLREQIVLWAIQDLRIKHERLALQVQIDDPLAWLNNIYSKVCNFKDDLQVVETFDETLICLAKNGKNKVAFSTLSPNEVLRINKERKSRLLQYAGNNPLMSISGSKSLKAREISVLNTGLLFDLELPIAWKRLTGQEIAGAERLWMYPI